MELVIPDGAQVHITVGHPPLLALPHEPGPLGRVAASPARAGRPVLKGVAAGVVVVAVFQAGRMLPDRAGTAAPVQAARAALAPPDTGRPGEIPPAFRAQIAQPPQVIPPPGATPPGPVAAPAPAPPAPNPFGLQG